MENDKNVRLSTQKAVLKEAPAIGQGHPTTIFGKYLFGRRFEI